MSDILDFYKEVMILLSEPFAFSKQLHLDMHWIKESILTTSVLPRSYQAGTVIVDNEARYYESLCHCCFRIAKVLKRRLPDSVHNRMVLGPQNEITKRYIKFCTKL